MPSLITSTGGELLLTHHRSELVLWRMPTGERVRAFAVPGGATITAAKALDVFVAEGAQGSIRLVDIATAPTPQFVTVDFKTSPHALQLARP